ncbi:Uncharacterised protein [Brucella neotomae]|nr:Uncharacterised protein [Brucella neotomae]
MGGFSGGIVGKVQLFDGARLRRAETGLVLFIIFADLILRDGGRVGNIGRLQLHIADLAIFRRLVIFLVRFKIGLEHIL